MQSTLVAGDKTVRKKFLKGAGKTKTSIAESEMAKAHTKYTDSSISKECGINLSSNEIKKHSTCQISGSKTILYKNMKKLLETKFKKTKSSTSSREKLSPKKSSYDPKVYNLTNAKEKTTLSGNQLKKSSSMSGSNTIDSRNSLKEEKYQKYHSTQISLPTYTLESKIEINYQESDVLNPYKTEEIKYTLEKSEVTPIKKTKSYEDSELDGKNSSKSKNLNLNTNSTKGQGKTKRYKISKRLASLAQHKELPIAVKKDLSFKPFEVPKRALLFRDTYRKIKSGMNDKNISQFGKKKGSSKSIINVLDSNRPRFSHFRKKRRLLKTSKPYIPNQRILELAKPIPKYPPVDILPPEKAYTVKKRSLKAKCSKRISELAFPLVRPEEYRIVPEYPFATKLRSLRAKCSKRVKELAKPLPRRCRSPFRKPSKNVQNKAQKLEQ